MSKVYIRDYDNINFYTAYLGFKSLGYEIVKYTDINEILDNEKEDVVVGYISDIYKILNDFNIEHNSEEYPLELRKYLKRNLRQCKLGEVYNNPNNWNVFIKPVEGSKIFNGTVVKQLSDLRSCVGIPFDTDIWCSEIVDFVSEYRCFIRYNEIVAMKHYNGDEFIVPNKEVINQAIKDFTTSPNAYVLDFGVTSDGETLLVEDNKAYSVGCYGLNPIDYAKFLITRWSELTNSQDYYR